MKSTTLTFCSIFIFGLLSALWSREMQFLHLNSRHGLSQNSAYCILQDNKGFIWIGTEAGLNKYDGYKITVYTSDIHDTNTLTNGFILSMCKDSSGYLWVGTEKGLNKLDPGQNTIVQFWNKPDDNNSISNNRIIALCADRFGLLWIGTENGLDCYDEKKKVFFRYLPVPGDKNSLSNEKIMALYEDKLGTLWIGTEAGLNKFDRKSGKFIRYINDPKNSNSLSNNSIRTIFEDNTGVIWIGTNGGGLNRFFRSEETFEHIVNNPSDPYSLSDDRVNVIYEDKKNTLWIGTNDGGLNEYNRKNKTFYCYKKNPNNSQSISNNRVISIYEDKSGGLWFGSYSGGVDIYSRELQKFTSYQNDPSNQNSLSHSDVRPIYEDRNSILWIGTDGGGLDRFDREKNEFVRYKHNPLDLYSISDNRVFAICEETPAIFWIGTTGGGLNKFDLKTERFTHFRTNPKKPATISSDNIRVIIKDHSGILWIGTNGGGLNRFDTKTERCKRFIHDEANPKSLQCDRIYSLYEDKFHTLWVGTFGAGLHSFNTTTEEFTRYTEGIGAAQSVGHDYVLSIIEDRTGTMWVGTNSGLCVFDRKKQVYSESYTTENGLTDDVMYNILEDAKGYLWISSNHGVMRFDPVSKKSRNYDIKDGLQSNEFSTGSSFKSKSGEMFFGGINGFSTFFPDSIRDNPYIPEVVITGLQIFNKTVPVGPMENGRTILSKSITETDKIELSYTDNVFSFEYAALDFVAPEDNQYAYKMDGLEKEWNYVGNRRFVSYTGLRPGHYIFRVKGSNNDEVWNKNSTDIAITIVPPYWRTWWFYTISGIVVLFLIAILYKYRIDELEKQKQEDERRRVTATFSQALEQGSTAVYRRNFNSDRYEYIGQGIKDITGYDAETINPSFLYSIIVSIEYKGILAGLTQPEVEFRIREGIVNRWLADIKLRTKTGDIRWVMEKSTVLHDDEGHAYGALGILSDITDRKLAEQELAKTTEQLRLSSEQLQMKNQEMEDDLNMAREVQMAFLSKNSDHFPKNVPLENCALQFNYKYIPATTLAGDFFTVVPLSDYQAGVLICDVMGHGARASLLTAYLQGLVEELVPVAADPGIFLKKLNFGLNAIMSQNNRGIFATAFYLVANVKNGTMQYSNAGHPRPFLLRRSEGVVDTIQYSESTAEPALGLCKDYNYSTYDRPVCNNDIILFFTDGLFEVTNAKAQLYGKDRLLGSVQKQIFKQPDQLLDGILNEVKNFTKTDEFKDDVCLVSMLVKQFPEKK